MLKNIFQPKISQLIKFLASLKINFELKISLNLFI